MFLVVYLLPFGPDDIAVLSSLGAGRGYTVPGIHPGLVGVP